MGIVILYLRDARKLVDGKEASLKRKEQEIEEMRETMTQLEKSKDSDKKSLESEKKALEEAKKEVQSAKEAVNNKERGLKELQSAIESRELIFSEKEKELESKRDKLEKKEKELLELEHTLESRESDLVEKEKEITRIESISRSVVVPDEEEEPVADKEEEKPVQEEIATEDEGAVESEAEKRKKMIDEELKKLIQQAVDEELEEDEMELESVEALEKGAMKICYLKKYYDVMADEIIYFPTVAKSLINYSLIEAAEEFYFDEEDEFPMEYSVALRSVATMAASEDDDDQDDDYMEKLAMDVDLSGVIPGEEIVEEEIATEDEGAVESEAEKRKKMIDEELKKLIQQAVDEELEEDEMELESVEALEKGAMKICYLKKYYDVMADEIIYFPTVAKSLINYSLIEAAEEFYFDEEDEFPMEYSVALRSVATMAASEDDDDQDDDYMEKLAMDVEI